MSQKFRPMNQEISIVAGGSGGARADRLPAGESNTYGILDLSDRENRFRLRRIYTAGRIGEDW
jgi:hypothetical protein